MYCKIFQIIVLPWNKNCLNCFVCKAVSSKLERSYHEEAFTQLKVTHHLELFKLMLQCTCLLVLLLNIIVCGIVKGVITQCCIWAKTRWTRGRKTVRNRRGRCTTRVICRTSTPVITHWNLKWQWNTGK